MRFVPTAIRGPFGQRDVARLAGLVDIDEHDEMG
jgi:hypothetical protein